MEGFVGDREKEILTNLLGVFQTYRLLWDSSSPQYFHKDGRNQAFEELLGIYKKLKPAATVTDVKKRLENMRSSFRKELKKVKESQTTGSGANEEYVPKLWYFELMRFLDDNSGTRIGRDTMDDTETRSSHQSIDNELNEEEEHDLGEITISKPENSSQIQNRPRGSNDPSLALRPHPVASKKAKMSFREKQEQLLDVASSMLMKEDNEVEVFGQCIAKQLMSLDPLQRTIAEKLFSETIFHGKLGQLTTTSSISLDSSPFSHRTQSHMSSHTSETSGFINTPHSPPTDFPFIDVHSLKTE